MKQPGKKILSFVLCAAMMSLSYFMPVSAADLNSSTNIPADAVTFNGYSYFLFTYSLGGSAAETYCESLGGHLATITSAEENAFLYAYIKSLGYQNAYFGFTDSEKEGEWKWVTNEAVSYTNWHSSEPNAESASEDWAMFYWKFSDGTWNDGGPSTIAGESQYICEWDVSAPAIITGFYPNEMVGVSRIQQLRLVMKIATKYRRIGILIRLESA